MDMIKEKLKSLPMCPGVYIMKNQNGNIIYVGKSKLLKNRVSQYFINSKNHTPKTLAMVENIYDFDYIVTDSEVEALVLECNLIKKHRPKYNILLKDDKHYPYIKLTLNEDYPRLYMTRKISRDGAKYFGPYMSSFMVKNAIETIRNLFKIRSCNKILPRDIGKSRPCLYYHMGQCSGPCCDKITKEEYREAFEQISNVLEGKYNELVSELSAKMLKASDSLEFERAARYRDKIEGIKILGEKQKIISTDDENRDIIGVYKGEFKSCVQIFYMRNGKIQGSEYFVFDDKDASENELIYEFIKQYYFTATNIPKEIIISKQIDDKDSIEEWLSDKTGHKIKIIVPLRGEKANLKNMVDKNAEETLKQHIFKRNREEIEENCVLTELNKLLMLNKTPFRIELYDISNISGASSVGVCVVYNNAKCSKKDYRKFNIKTVDGADDYESMREVISRRINKAYEEIDLIKKGELSSDKAKFLPLPDLILLDGGKGHVSAVRTLMDTMGEEIPVFGLVKDDKHKTRGITDDTEEFEIEFGSVLFRFLFEMQEEVHRFAIKSFRQRYETSAVYSELESIDGIGKTKRKKLLEAFITIERIKKADIKELSSVVDIRSAQNVYNHFNRGDINDK